MDTVYITAILSLKFKEKLLKPIKLKENVYLTNNSSHTAGYISVDKMYTIGALEAEYLTKDYPVIYKIHSTNNDSEARDEIINFLREVQAFLASIWLLKDNSSNCELGFVFGQHSEYTHSNALSLHYTTCEGEKIQTILDPEELKTVCTTHTNFFQAGRVQDEVHPTVFHGGITRLDRASLFLMQARASDDIGQKIANYCSFFESLFSTSSAELSHQLSERCAFFLSDLPQERLDTFKKIKKAYGIRSKIVHGDILKSSAITDLTKISKSCDDAARESINRLIKVNEIEGDFTSSNELLDEFMQQLIFGIRTSAIYVKE